MKKWNSAVLALALLALPFFVMAQPERLHETAVSGASCCCCSPEKAHSETGSCSCDGCAQKNTPHCGCVQTALGLPALLFEVDSGLTLVLCGGVLCRRQHLVIRTDPPLLRPPIFSCLTVLF